MSLQIFPAANMITSSGLAYLQDTYNQREALDQLWETFHFRAACDKKTLPKNSGMTYRVHRWNSLGIGTTAATEGDQSTPLTISNRTGTATVSEFSSFINVSSLLADTAPDDIIAAAAKQLGYRAGRTLDIMTRNVIDSQAHNTNVAPANGSTITIEDLRTARHSMKTANIPTFSGGEYLCYIHPLNSFDLINDPAANGFADIFKYTTPKQVELVRYSEDGILQSVAGCKIQEVTNCFAYSNSGNYYRTYIFGAGGLATVDLAGSAPSNVRDPKSQNFNLNIIRNPAPSILDPEGMLGGAVGYRFVSTTFFTSGVQPLGDVFRMRTFDTKPTISA